MDEVSKRVAKFQVGCRFITLSYCGESTEEDDCVDPCFFEEEYTIAGATAFSIWNASRTLAALVHQAIQAQLTAPSPFCSVLNLLTGGKVVELGSGAGLGGLSLAFAGASVLLTDLNSVCQVILSENCERNRAGEQSISVSSSGNKVVRNSWKNSIAVGDNGGSVAWQALDWTKPCSEQVSCEGNDVRDADFVVAVDTVWLTELITPFAATVVDILSHGRVSGTEGSLQQAQRCCLLGFQERSTATSEVFAGYDRLLHTFQQLGCKVLPLYKHQSIDFYSINLSEAKV